VAIEHGEEGTARLAEAVRYGRIARDAVSEREAA
jgi:hypothetical protein